MASLTLNSNKDRSVNKREPSIITFFSQKISSAFGDDSIKILTKSDQLEVIQELWQGYGNIYRIRLESEKRECVPHGCVPTSVVVKHVCPPDVTSSSRETTISHQRKLKSYKVETCFYEKYSEKLVPDQVRVPKNYKVNYTETPNSENSDNGVFLILEDLDAAGFSNRESNLNSTSVKPLVSWLAQMHQTFLVDTGSIKVSGEELFPGLWAQACYWHLDTRPDEFDALHDTDPLKKHAGQLDSALKSARFKTLCHGDAKIANFCFPNTTSNFQIHQSVAAVDFQYCGAGVGVRDLAYLLGSCLTENELCKCGDQILVDYLNEVTRGMSHIDGEALKSEWTELWSVCFADFERFLAGWSPGHWKRTGYTRHMTTIALKNLEKGDCK